MAQGVAQHATGPPYTFRTVADNSTRCRNVRPSKAAHPLPSVHLAAFHVQRMEERAALHSHPLVNYFAASHSRAHSGPEYRVLTRRLTKHSKILSA
ncbi:hypothetical protein PoB_001651300 [Plakobranchus ocellatus]|uniref:Uncharacterized protein n=1 Tax=Plakobranchus ocellatus TaxID=259542 RepID=A0AAV3Z6B8_9GAST|nr:hypothetical protein PoB_001651300 [Plakobranchus ocellatus]